MFTIKEISLIINTKTVVSNTFHCDTRSHILGITPLNYKGIDQVRLSTTETPLNEICDYLNSLHLCYEIEENNPVNGFWEIYIPFGDYKKYIIYSKLKGGYYAE